MKLLTDKTVRVTDHIGACFLFVDNMWLTFQIK